MRQDKNNTNTPDKETSAQESPNSAKGRVSQIIGTVVDVSFEEEGLPKIYSALETKIPADPRDPEGDKKSLILEVEQHRGENVVRTIAMGSTDGLKRGDKVINTGESITVPVGEAALGRIFNVLGEPVDEAGEINAEKNYPIHRPAPEFSEQSTKVE